MVYMYHSFLIHSSADGHLGCYHVLAMINSAAMNIGVHMSLSDLVSLVCMPRSGIAGSYGSSISSFLTTISLCPHMAEREGSTFCFSSYKDTNPIMEIPLAWPHLTLMTSQSPHLQIPIRWRLELQHMNLRWGWGGHIPSVLNTHCEPTAVLKGKKLCCE